MPVLSAQFRTNRGLAQLLLCLALAGCGARPVHEEQPGALPGGGTYTWEAAGVEAVPSVPTPPPARSAAEDDIRAAIDNGLTNRGYEQRPEGEASWRVSYRTDTATRKEKLAPNDRMLQPRMVCNPPMECMIIQEMTHFGPPRYAENPEVSVTENIVQVQIHDLKTGLLVWQGKVATEPDEVGHTDNDTLRRKMNRLLRTLPSARHKTASRVPAGTATVAPQYPQ